MAVRVQSILLGGLLAGLGGAVLSVDYPQTWAQDIRLSQFPDEESRVRAAWLELARTPCRSRSIPARDADEAGAPQRDCEECLDNVGLIISSS
jgi:hypothetical protein